MKIILVIRQSLDGIISREINDGYDWGSAKDRQFFENKVKEAQVVIMGKRTFEKTKISHPFIINQPLLLVFTHQKVSNMKNIIFFDGTPTDAVKTLEKRRIKKAVLIGGGNINNQFLKQKLINELFITVSPHIFAKKTRVFGENAVDIRLKLISVKKLGNNELLLHYKVQT